MNYADPHNKDVVVLSVLLSVILVISLLLIDFSRIGKIDELIALHSFLLLLRPLIFPVFLFFSMITVFLSLF